MELDIKKIFFLLFYKLWIIILCAIIGFAFTFFYSKANIAPLYTSSMQMYVLSDTDITNKNLSDLNYSTRLTNTYIIFLKSELVLQKIRDYSDVDMSLSQISSSISASSINNTEIFKVSVTTTSAETSYKLADAIAKIAPDEIVSISKANPIKVITNPKFSNYPQDNTIKYSFIGMLIAIILSSLAIIFYDLLDTRIKDEGDIIGNYNYPIIGIIPKIDIEVS